MSALPKSQSTIFRDAELLAAAVRTGFEQPVPLALVVSEVLAFLKQEQISFRLFKYPESGRTDLCTYKAELSKGNLVIPGFSSSIDSSAQMKCLVEAFERWVIEDAHSSKSNLNTYDFASIEFRSIPELIGAEQLMPASSFVPAYHFNSDSLVGLDSRAIVADGRSLPRNSSGWAAHGTRFQAASAAALEVIERHQLLMSWMTSEKPSRIANHSSQLFTTLESQANDRGYDLALHCVSSDAGLHTTVASLRSRKDPSYIYLGFGKNLRIERAVEESLLELQTVWTFQALIPIELGEEPVRPVTKELGSELASFIDPEESRSLNQNDLDTDNDLAGLFTHFDFYFYASPETTSRGLTNTHVVKAYSPKVIPLFKGSCPIMIPPALRSIVVSSGKVCPF